MRGKKVKAKKAAEPLKLDLGAGKNPREGFEPVDIIDFGQKWKVDLRKRWPWADESVSEAHMSHTIEHFTGPERVHLMNELYRVLVPGGKATIIAPDFSSSRAYGDPTHQWPPMGAFWCHYLSREWRRTQAPHTDIEYNPAGYSCDFGTIGGHSLHPELVGWNDERRRYAQQWYKEACPDIQFIVEKK